MTQREKLEQLIDSVVFTASREIWFMTSEERDITLEEIELAQNQHKDAKRALLDEIDFVLFGKEH